MTARILIVGLGSIGKRHLSLCRELFPQSEIMVLHHKSCNLVDCPSDFCTSSMNSAERFAPNFAIICNPSVFHKKIAMKLANKGVHLLIEKPICDNLRDAKEVLELAGKNGVVLQVGYNLRFLKSLQKFKDVIYSCRIGRVTSVQSDVGQFLPDWRPNSDWRSSVSANSKFGGGALLELSHEFDYLSWIFGEVKNVIGVMNKQSNFNLDVEDTVNAILEFKNSTPPQTSGAPVIAAVTLDFVRRTSSRSCIARGENGTLIWDAIKSEVNLKLPDGSFEVIFKDVTDRNFSYLEQLKSFTYAISNQNRDSSILNNGMEALSIVEAIRLSNRDGGIKYSPNSLLRD